MNTSVIRYRVADFLKQYAPFDTLSEADLLALASNGRVKFHEAGEQIYTQGQAKTPWLWIIQQGRVELMDERSGTRQLRDVVGEGDVLGLDRFGGDGAYQYTAITAGDVILYAMDANAFEQLLERNAGLRKYFAAHFSVSETGGARRSWLDADFPPVDFLRSRVPLVSSNLTVKEVAVQLERSAAGVIGIESESGQFVGIVTTRDLCTSVAENIELVPRAIPQAQIAITTRQAVRQIARAHSEVLVLRDATGKTVAILTASDLAMFCDRNPARVLHEIRHARSVEDLTVLLKQADRLVQDGLAASSDIEDCTYLAFEAIAGAYTTCFRFAQQSVRERGLQEPPVPFCLLVFGTVARGDLVRFTPSKIGVVFDDSDTRDKAGVRAYFEAVTGRVEGWLARCGLDTPGAEWPIGLRASLSISEWKHFFTDTIQNPLGSDLFARREFFDIRGLSNNDALAREISDEIASELKQSQLLIPLLANDTLARLPPLTFFHGLVLESDGEQHGTLDLNQIVLNPIADAARVFALAAETPVMNTLERLAAAAEMFPESKAVFQNAAEAFRFALYQRALTGSAVIAPSSLNRLDQRVLKTTFTSILRLLELTSATFVKTA